MKPGQERYTNKPFGQDEFLKVRSSTTSVYQKIRELENNGWVTPLTRKIEVMAVTYNQNLNLLTAIYVNFYFNSAGHIYKMVEPVSLWLDPYRHWTNWLADLTWLAAVLHITIVELVQIAK